MPVDDLIRIHNPARTAEIVGCAAPATPRQVDRAVAAAGRAAKGWARTAVSDRAAALLAAAATLEAAVRTDAPLLARESGKPLADCRGEIAFSAAVLRWYADAAPGLLADHLIDDAQGRLTVRQRPYGPVAALTPWNAPVVLTALKLAPALVAGNALLVKPSPLAPLAIGALLTRLAEHFPAGLLHTLHGHAGVATHLAGHPGVYKVAFTGGAAAARAIGRPPPRPSPRR